MVLAGKVAGGVLDALTPGTWPLLSVAVGSTQETVAMLDAGSGATVCDAGQPEITGAIVSPLAASTHDGK